MHYKGPQGIKSQGSRLSVYPYAFIRALLPGTVWFSSPTNTEETAHNVSLGKQWYRVGWPPPQWGSGSWLNSARFCMSDIRAVHYNSLPVSSSANALFHSLLNALLPLVLPSPFGGWERTRYTTIFPHCGLTAAFI